MKRILTLLVLCFTVTAVAQNFPRRGGDNQWVYGSNNNNWDSSWNRRPNPSRGACFFTTAPFQGNKFCVRSGDKLPQLPGNIGDNISSIQTYGGARVRIFNDRNFRGGSANVGGSVPDLRTMRFGPSNTWNNRISSIMVF